MDRPIVYSQEQGRSFDFASLAKDAMLGLAWLSQDLLGSTITVAAGMAATATGTLAVTVAAGRVMQLANADSTAFAGGVLAQDTTQILQQGKTAAQSFTLSTGGLAAGQSRWALIEVGFSQADAIAASDPNNGVLPYFNVSNPLSPLIGAGGNGLAQSTVRQGLAVVKIIYGNVATTGAEAPPQPDSGYVPLYLIDLAYGQTTVSQGQILTSGPSVGTNVPSNYSAAPFLAGLLQSHHNCKPGQAPKINLATEVTGILPYANFPTIRQALTGNRTYYVRSTGNDTNDGLTTGTALLTLQKAWNIAQQTIDMYGLGVTIDFGGAAFAPVSCVGALLSSGVSNLVFNCSSAASIAATNGNCFAGSAGANFTITGNGNLTLTATCSGTVGFGITANFGSAINFSGVTFGACTTHWGATQGGICAPTGNYAITGAATQHVLVDDARASGTNTIVVTVTGTPAFSAAFAVAQNGGVIALPSTVMSFSGAATGSRYSGTSNGVINTAGSGATFFPGNAVGTTATGGQYL